MPFTIERYAVWKKRCRNGQTKAHVTILKKCGLYWLIAVLLMGSSSVLTVGSATAQRPAPAEQLVGTWRLILVDNILPDGTRIHLYGPNPEGILMFDAENCYALQIYRAERDKFVANDKSKGTPEENSAAVLGSNAHFGQYSIDPNGGAITFRIERASFPNWDGTEQRRTFTISGDELTYSVPTPTSGGSAIGEVKWKRVR